MNKQLSYSLLLILFLSFTTSCQKEKIEKKVLLTTGWSFKQATKDSTKWRSANVPGTVHQDLLFHNVIPDPFISNNEKKVQWIEDQDWIYKKEFNIDKRQLLSDKAFLTFEGLDTHADVYLNDSLVLIGNNMYKKYEVDVLPLLKEKKNKLQLIFHSPIKYAEPFRNKNGFEYPADNDARKEKASVFNRKAPYQFGWDWGIRLATAGIWKETYLQFINKAQILDYHTQQKALTNKKALINHQIKINAFEKQKVKILITMEIDQAKTKKIYSFDLHKGENTLNCMTSIFNPQRWMPNGWGKQNLYSCKVQLINKKDTLDQSQHRIGLRTIEVITEKDGDGETFYFKVNGRPLYAKGANYIPNDLLLPRVNDSIYKRTFEDVKRSNMNFIRVWGGGIYEKELFYDLADEYGILVWQDFMFACTPYPSDKAFLKNVEEEIRQNIKRLRNHPCLAMWCGNNEIMEALTHWGFDKRYTPEQMQLFFESYPKIFKELIPRILRELDSERYYVDTSPYYVPDEEKKNTYIYRDSHDWTVWHGRQPFSVYKEHVGHFSSEFGFQSFPEMKTIRSFAEPKDYDLQSDVMKTHQKSYIGNEAIKEYMGRYYNIPDKFEDFVYVGLVLQGYGLNTAFEAQRIKKPYCMGTVYWQLNDCWPAVSWSSIDFYGNWKAVQYQAQRAYKPLNIFFDQKEGLLNCYAVSDELKDRKNLQLVFALCDFQGKIKKQDNYLVNIPQNTSTRLKTINLKEWIKEEDKSKTYLAAMLIEKGSHFLAKKIHYFEIPKKLDLPLAKIKESILEQKDGMIKIQMKTDVLAKDIFIEIPNIQGTKLSDNFFDLTPNETKTITIFSPKIKEQEKVEIKVHQLRETYN